MAVVARRFLIPLALVSGILLSLGEVRLAAAPTDRFWPLGPVLDQGPLPACEGFAWLGYLHAGPQPSWPVFNGAMLYYAAKHRDGHPELDGTWSWAVVAVLQEAGYLQTVRYTSVLTDALAYLATTGPVVVEAPWPGTPSRHAFLLYGVDAARTHVWLQNSWGDDWGTRGTARWPVQILLNAADAWYVLPTKPSQGPALWRVINGWEY